jgi:hypothetical protein
MLIRQNARDKSRFDLFRINIVTGASELKFENTEYADLFTDSDFQLRLATRLAADGTAEIFERKPDGTWTPFVQVPIGDIDTFRLIDMGADGNTLYFLDSRERDRAGLFSMDMTTREARLLAADDEADIVEATLDEQRRPVAARANRDRSRWYAVNPVAKQDLADLARHGSGDVYFLSDSADRRKASVFFERDSESGEFALLDRERRERGERKSLQHAVDHAVSCMRSLALGLLPLELSAVRERQRRDDFGVKPCIHIIAQSRAMRTLLHLFISRHIS